MENCTSKRCISSLVILDCETTGLSDEDELIELGLIVCNVIRPEMLLEEADLYCGFREPKRQVCSSAEALSGLTTEMLKGQSLDNGRISTLLKKAQVIVSHNAQFDRQMVVQVLPSLGQKRWLCSLYGINWPKFGCFDRSLSGLVAAHKLINNSPHRAIGDAAALLRLLNLSNLVSQQTYLAELLQGK